MANIKETILNTLKDNILNIQKQNGYLSDIQNVFIGSYDIQNLNSFPVCTIAEGNSKILKNFNAKGDELIELDILVKFYVEENPETSNTINSINIKADFKKLLYGDKNIITNYLSTLNQIPEIKKIVIEQETGILEYNSKIEYTIVLLKIEYLSYAEHIDGSSYSIVIPNVLSNYSLTSHQHSQYFLNSNSGSLTGATINLSGYALTSSLSNLSTSGHTHTLFQNNIGINGNLSVTGKATIGYQNTNLGSMAFATGFQTHADGNYTFTCGQGNNSNYNYGFSGGYNSTSNATGAYAFGYQCIASGNYATANGQSCNATSINSKASGMQSTANGQGSFVHGWALQADGNYQTIFGLKNIINSTDLFQIGNGGDTYRSNIFTVSPNTVRINGRWGVTGNLESPKLNLDGEGFKYISGNEDVNNLLLMATDGNGIKLSTDETTLKIEAYEGVSITANNNSTAKFKESLTAGDSAIYFGENAFRIRFDRNSFRLIVEYWYIAENRWMEQTQLGYDI